MGETYLEERWRGVGPIHLNQTAISAFGEVSRKISDQEVVKDPIHLNIIDTMRLSLKSRIDVYPGESEPLDVAARFDDDVQCFGWSNEGYFSDPPWRELGVAPRSLSGESNSSLFGAKCIGGFLFNK
jgi:hypothetical protein